MKKKLRMWWAIASAVWILVMINMSFSDLKYGIEYRLFHGRVQAAHQAKLAAYEQDKREGEEGARKLLQAANRYEELQFLSLAAKRSGRTAAGETQSEYARTLDEIAALEKTYGKLTLRKYREQDGATEQALLDEVRARLIVPQLREPRLGAVLFHMIASPLVLLLALWVYEKGYRRMPWLDRYFGSGRRRGGTAGPEIE